MPDAPSIPREVLLARTLVELGDTLVDDFDIVELLTLLVERCVAVLGVSAAGLMLAAPGGDLRVVASSSEAMRVVELFELQSEEGPCLDCYRTGEAVAREELSADGGHWPHFGPVAFRAGFRLVHALPMRLRGQVIGALNLFRTDEGTKDDFDVLAGQALADMATIAIFQHRAVLEAQGLNEQLNSALNSRVLIEQAKGVLAERLGIDVERAFSLLRAYARGHNLRLVTVAEQVIDNHLVIDAFEAPLRSVRGST
jgi:GAF domain-containing protein